MNRRVHRYTHQMHCGILMEDRYPWRHQRYLKAATNNRTATVLSAFQNAMQVKHQECERRENSGVMHSTWLAETVHFYREVCITMRRIERLWSDLFTGYVSFFYHLFYFMEDINILNPNIRFVCSHYVT